MLLCDRNMSLFYDLLRSSSMLLDAQDHLKNLIEILHSDNLWRSLLLSHYMVNLYYLYVKNRYLVSNVWVEYIVLPLFNSELHTNEVGGRSYK